MRSYIYRAVKIAVMMIATNGCSSTTVVQEKPAIPEVPEYVKVPHPVSFELSSLRAIFYSPLAPQDIQGEFSKTCDQEFQKLSELSNSRDERQKAASELVSGDPERMHWCFYGKISKLEEVLQGDTTWGTRQKKVFETFTFISPVANAFLEVYHDSRYFRWATQYYSKISEWVFFRKVTPGPEATVAIMQGVGNAGLEPWIPVDKTAKKDSVFSKYGISLAPTVANGKTPLDQTERVPASTPEKTEEAGPDVDPGVDAFVPSKTTPKGKEADPTIGY